MIYKALRLSNVMRHNTYKRAYLTVPGPEIASNAQTSVSVVWATEPIKKSIKSCVLSSKIEQICVVSSGLGDILATCEF